MSGLTVAAVQNALLSVSSSISIVYWFYADLKKISELQQEQSASIELEPYLKKLNNARRRIVLVNNILQNVQVNRIIV
jgi:Snapin/Pallidin